MPIWDEDHPVRPPVRPPPDRPPSEPTPPSEDWDEDEPEPEPEPQPQPPSYNFYTVFRGTSEAHLESSNFDSNLVCFTGDYDWGDVYDKTRNSWYQSTTYANYPAPFAESSTMSALGTTMTVPNSTTLTLSSEDLMNAQVGVRLVMAPNSYMRMKVKIHASDEKGGFLGDYIETVTVRLEGGDSIEAVVGRYQGGAEISRLSIIKNQVDYVDEQAAVQLALAYNEIEIQLTLENLTSCRPADPEQDEFVVDDDDGGDEGSEGDDGTNGGFEWTQDDAWVLLGALVLIILGSYLINTIRGEDND